MSANMDSGLAATRQSGMTLKQSSRRAEGLEGDDGAGVLHADDGLHLLGDEVADIGALIDIKFHQQVEIAGGGINLRSNLGVGQPVGDLIGLAELALDLHKERNHANPPPKESFR